MNFLTVFAQPDIVLEDHVLVPVFWRVGVHNKGAIRIRLPLSCEDTQAAAEAISLRYLLGVANVFNVNCTGINIKIIVSKGAIKKMSRQASQKQGLYQYGYPILTRYAEADISVSKDKSWFPIQNGFDATLTINGEAYRGVEIIETEILGAVGITRHALERYAQYCGTNNMSTTWKNLCRRLRSALEKISLPPSVILHKLKKYGDEPEVWRHPDNSLHYVFCRQHGKKVLVTMYDRAPDENLAVFRSEYDNNF